jgi:hypothetical protein
MCAMRQSPHDWARARARHEHGRRVLEQVLRDCRDGGVDVLPVKGIITGQRLYADPGERSIRDIDLRVRPEDLDRVRRVGMQAGWRTLAHSWAYGTLAFDVMGFLVEFESHVGPPGLCGLRVDAMIARAVERSQPFDLPHLEPEIHDHAVLLCVNAFKDKLTDTPRGAMRDLELIPHEAGFSSARLAELATESGVASIVWIVASWFVEARHCDAWRPIREQLGPLPPRPLYTFVFEWGVRSSPRRRHLLRVLARAGSDRAMFQLWALGAMAADQVAKAIGGGYSA